MNENRKFLAAVIASGLDLGMISPDDVLRHATAEVLAHHLPVALKSKLLSASLQADRMTPALVVETLGVEAFAEHVPAPILWACVAESANRALSGAGPELTPPVVGEEEGSRQSAATRKPNRSARPSRVRAGATSRPKALASTATDEIDDEDEDSVFDVDTRVGAETAVVDLDPPEESGLFGDELGAAEDDPSRPL